MCRTFNIKELYFLEIYINLGIGWIILSEQPICRTILPTFISMAIRKEFNSYNNHMDGSDCRSMTYWH